MFALPLGLVDSVRPNDLSCMSFIKLFAHWFIASGYVTSVAQAHSAFIYSFIHRICWHCMVGLDTSFVCSFAIASAGCLVVVTPICVHRVCYHRSVRHLFVAQFEYRRRRGASRASRPLASGQGAGRQRLVLVRWVWTNSVLSPGTVLAAR